MLPFVTNYSFATDNIILYNYLKVNTFFDFYLSVADFKSFLI